MNVRAILFDIDGTLVDSNEQHVSAWAFAFREAGHPQEPDDIRSQVGKGGDLLVPALLPDVPDKVSKAIAERHGTYFSELYLDQIRPFEGAAALITRVHDSGRKVGLASSAKQEELDHYVALLGIADLIAGSATSDDVDTSKPEPDIFSAALANLDVAPSEALVVGDTIYDIEAASRAGIAAIGLTSGFFSARQLKDAGAIAAYPGVAELLDTFETSPLAD